MGERAFFFSLSLRERVGVRGLTVARNTVSLDS
jgi:hypothetical protein